MESITGNKIFVLYPDAHLRKNIFYGDLRNRFVIYYIYDYEKIRPLIEYYPGSLIVLNLVKNDLGWLPEELYREFTEFPEDKRPKIIGLYDGVKPSELNCTQTIHYNGNNDNLKKELSSVFINWGGKGRRNFVRYGGADENIASLKVKTNFFETMGIVHDISAAGLSCSLMNSLKINGGETVSVTLSLDDKTIELDANKLLERNFNDNIVHVLKFNDKMSADIQSDLLDFIYKSLDTKMESFIKKLSN